MSGVNWGHNSLITSCLCVCFSSAGINESYQMGLFQVLAAILHLGNVEIKDRDSDSSVIPVRIIFKLIIRVKRVNKQARYSQLYIYRVSYFFLDMFRVMYSWTLFCNAALSKGKKKTLVFI